MVGPVTVMTRCRMSIAAQVGGSSIDGSFECIVQSDVLLQYCIAQSLYICFSKCMPSS